MNSKKIFAATLFFAALLLCFAQALQAEGETAGEIARETVSLEIGVSHAFNGITFTVADASGRFVMLDAADAQGNPLLKNFILSVNDSIQADGVQAKLLSISASGAGGAGGSRSSEFEFSVAANQSAPPTPREIEERILEAVTPSETTTVCVEKPPIIVQVTRESRAYASASDASAGATLVSLKIKNSGSVAVENVELTEKIPGESAEAAAEAAAEAVFDEAPLLAGSEAKWFVASLAPGETREFNYALRKPVYASAFQQPVVNENKKPVSVEKGGVYGAGAGGAAGSAQLFDAELWPPAFWIVFLSLVAFVAAQIYFAETAQKRKLKEGPRGYRKRKTLKTEKR